MRGAPFREYWPLREHVCQPAVNRNAVAARSEIDLAPRVRFELLNFGLTAIVIFAARRTFGYFELAISSPKSDEWWPIEPKSLSLRHPRK